MASAVNAGEAGVLQSQLYFSVAGTVFGHMATSWSWKYKDSFIEWAEGIDQIPNFERTGWSHATCTCVEGILLNRHLASEYELTIIGMFACKQHESLASAEGILCASIQKWCLPRQWHHREPHHSTDWIALGYFCRLDGKTRPGWL